MDYSNLLNTEQLQAVINTEGPVLVSAGAGSGKTRVLTYRIAYLLTELHIDPYRILAITFTNKATNEMKERVCKIREDASNVLVATFHSFCVRMLRKYQSVLTDYQPNFSVYDEDDQKEIYKQIFLDLSYDKYENDRKKAIRNIISSIKNDNIDIDEYCRIHKHSSDINEIRSVYLAYEKALKRNNAMDFDDLLINFYKLIVTNADVRESLQERFLYIHVDEFQDTNKLQYDIIRILADKHKNIFVVGDEDQSIYSWRGANIGNIFQFSKDFKNVKVFKLEQNYRSTKAILDKANMLISNNKNRLPKKLYTANEQGNDVSYYCARDEQDEACYVVRHIVMQRNQGVDLNNIAIIVRLNSQTRQFEENLLSYNIPHKMYAGFKFYERAEIKSTLAYLKAIINPNDNVSLMRLLNFPKRGIGLTSIEQLKILSETRQKSIKDIVYNYEVEDLKPALKKKLKVIKDLLEHNDKNAEMLGIYDLITDIVETAEILQSFNVKDEQEYERSENIKELIKSIKEYEDSNPGATLNDYIERISLITDMDREQNGVVITTVHKAKGLEFDIVYIPGLEEKMFPLYREDWEDKEEERRLMYVAMTRARKELYLTSAMGRFNYATKSRTPSTKSKFLKEIDMVKDQAFGYGGYYGDNYSSSYSGYIRARKEHDSYNSDYGYNNYNKSSYGGGTSYNQGYTNTTRTASTKTYAAGTSSLKGGLNIPGMAKASEIGKKNIDTSKVVVGAKVNHIKFGNGIITDTSTYASNKCVTIDFGVIGKKSLSLDYAPITFVD